MTGKIRPKILFADYFSGLGGGQAVLLSLLSGLRKKYDVSVLLFTRGPFEKALDKAGIRRFYVETPKKVRYRYVNMFREFEVKLIAALEQADPDLVYCNGFLSVKLCGPACKKMGLPLIWHKHLIPEKGYFSYSGFQIRRAAGYAGSIICVSEASAAAMKKAGVPAEKITVIHNAVEGSKKKKSGRIKLPKSASGKFIFGAMGYLRRNKGFDIYIEAASRLISENKKVFFILAGRGEGADHENELYLKKLAGSAELKDSFMFAGYTDKNAFYNTVDCFVMPSPNEPFGMVTLEAQAAGIPVAGFATGGTGEIVVSGKTGWLSMEVSADGLYRTMKQAVTGNIKAAGLNAKKHALTFFTPEKQVKKVAEIIEASIEK